jgi:hypothetical protein
MVVETLPQALGMFAVESDPVILPLGPDGGGRVEVATASDDAGGHWGRWPPLRRHRRDPDKGAPGSEEACLPGFTLRV